ncbi:hypothetical protein NQD34_004286 [Periophthalmus magnuspinnatus]|nr:hypothetical protein NQD34_004286 [Periophthalmus magnuspinnatus]
MFLSVLLLLICLCFLLVQFSSRRPKNFPPGPIALPFLGNALNLAVDNPLGYLEMLRRTYRNVYSLYMGPRVAVVVSGTQALKEALVNKAVDFAGRPQDLFMNDITERRGTVMDLLELDKPHSLCPVVCLISGCSIGAAAEPRKNYPIESQCIFDH